ncbi:hypothetical protein L596_002689 [Steinernema carpocapsae]|uniref:glutathione gamma-glutamylcysteinyltransferase n=1 Tax=Steinernema carpocapsae TaxID=34508 RepID=A0A4U8URS9_STECR|nr:hypothetical protein L596_002689 [Steinernema carpocapsae]
MNSKTTNFYRRELPESCIDFSSEEGRSLFSRSLNSGHANIYFKLAAQFRTQDEPAYCGLSTLVMVLNALEVDPGRVWKAPWRFYHESMLDCCLPLEVIKKTGITVDQFACLARCNRLQTTTNYASDTEASRKQFREDLLVSVTSEDFVMVVSYDRSVFGQTGTGHFSPVAAFDPETDRALIMDVARFKYPPHWVSMSLIHRAMLSKDPATEKARGFFTLKLRSDTRPKVVFELSSKIIEESRKEFNEAVRRWEAYLLSEGPASLENICGVFKREFAVFGGGCCSQKSPCCSGNGMGKAMKNCCEEISEAVGNTRLNGVMEGQWLTVMLMAWPLKEGASADKISLLRMAVNDDIQAFDRDSRNEIEMLNCQLNTIMRDCCSV